MVEAVSPTNARTSLNEIKRRISSINDEKGCLTTLRSLHIVLFGEERERSNHDEFAFDSSTRRQLLTNFYTDVCSILLGLAASSWFSKFSKTDEQDVFNSFFLSGEPSAVFIALAESLKKSSHSSVVRCSIGLLEAFLENGLLKDVLFDQAKVLPTVRGARSLQYDPATQIYWDELIRRIISLPDRAANIFKLKERSLLWPNNFFRILGTAITKSLLMIQDYLTESKDCSIQFISQIFSRVCMHYHGNELYSVLLPELQKMMSKSPLGCRICQKLFSLVQESHLEAVLEPLLMTNTSYKFLFSLLGDISSSGNHKLKFLMTHKFLLHRYYKKDSIPYCIIGYLTESKSESKTVLLETTHKLLDVWGNSSVLKHKSYEQHLYITKCILLSIGFLHQQTTETMSSKSVELKTSLISKLLDTLPPHLQCPVEKFRKLGMIVAEEITRILPHKGIEPLKFEFQRDEDSIYIASLAVDPTNALEKINMLDSFEPDATLNQSKETTSSEHPEKSQKKVLEDSDLDSDDDLEPYPMDEGDEDVINGVRPPVYLRDCIAGLLSTDDPSRLEACLLVAEKLIRREQAALPETVVELVKILLYLQDNYDTTNFVLLRHGAMVAAAVKCPKLVMVVNYLTTEFYQENYNLRQRMDMLEVLSAAAQELSQPIDSNTKALQKHLPLPTIPGRKAVKEKPNWQLIVEERIKSKTRIISHGPSQPNPKAIENRFSSVAGDFFFPLLKNYDSKLNTFDLLGDDSLVLGKFIHTLGSIIQAATGLNITRLMAKAMLDFIWSIRFHREPFVRQAIMYGLCMTVLACPSHILITELNSDLLECHNWLKDIASNDADTDCKKIALQTLLLINSVMQDFSNI